MSRVKVRKATPNEIVRFEKNRQELQQAHRTEMTRRWTSQQRAEHENLHNAILESFRWSPKQYGRYDTGKQRLNSNS